MSELQKTDNGEQAIALSNKPVDRHGANLDYHDAGNVVNPEHIAHHIVSPVMYLAIFGVLMIGTLATVGFAYLPLGPFNAAVAIAIACTKAVFVVLFFMHVKYSSRLVKLTVVSGFFTFLVLVIMSMSDYISRAWGQW
ncbi:cytochrome C oxidase subunit IV family protein [Terriglobus aquaticus]|uniref:Cytochrome C oxidase subunit IV family protein n=1 Tax=Terriglobus aquaticus TaxID=940139 RepID=A0ABW9KH81_9BACT|nr:cytochrome C oxidase subunit IV family protein [Terriglobus aquaticus]